MRGRKIIESVLRFCFPRHPWRVNPASYAPIAFIFLRLPPQFAHAHNHGCSLQCLVVSANQHTAFLRCKTLREHCYSKMCRGRCLEKRILECTVRSSWYRGPGRRGRENVRKQKMWGQKPFVARRVGYDYNKWHRKRCLLFWEREHKNDSDLLR